MRSDDLEVVWDGSATGANRGMLIVDVEPPVTACADRPVKRTSRFIQPSEILAWLRARSSATVLDVSRAFSIERSTARNKLHGLVAIGHATEERFHRAFWRYRAKE